MSRSAVVPLAQAAYQPAGTRAARPDTRRPRC